MNWHQNESSAGILSQYPLLECNLAFITIFGIIDLSVTLLTVLPFNFHVTSSGVQSSSYLLISFAKSVFGVEIYSWLCPLLSFWYKSVWNLCEKSSSLSPTHPLPWNPNTILATFESESKPINPVDVFTSFAWPGNHFALTINIPIIYLY